MTANNIWQRPKTTRRYVHPPKAERMYTLWAEGKLIFGQIQQCFDWRSYKYLECSGLWLVHGADYRAFDFHDACNVMHPRGIPVHGLIHKTGQLQVELETFCDISRTPTCFLQLRLTNLGEEALVEPLGLLLRTGKEKHLAFATPDVYESYAPDVQVWKDAPATWRYVQKSPRTVLLDEDTFLLTQTDMPLEFCEAEGILRMKAVLQPGQTAVLHAAFGKGTPLPFDYGQERTACIAFWERELARLTDLPEAIRKDPEKLAMVENLTVHILQCFCYGVRKDYLLPRQGGMQRLVWPGENFVVLAALSRAGNFEEYIDGALSLYFDVLQAPSGEVRPYGEGWAGVTAYALYSFAHHALHRNVRSYFRYRDNALAAMEWIRKTRESTAQIPGCFPGLFPPMRGCDWDAEFQYWVGTDAANVTALSLFADAAERFQDERAPEIRALAQDYRQTLQTLLDARLQDAADSPTFRIPLRPDGNDKALIDGFYPYLGHGIFCAMGLLSKEDILRVKAYVDQEEMYQNGLYGHMPYEDGNLHIWYTSAPDYEWFMAWMRLGMYDKAQEILESQIRYSMTDEYYMLERYADNDPYYVPWSPNASANARTILMLMELNQ